MKAKILSVVVAIIILSQHVIVAQAQGFSTTSSSQYEATTGLPGSVSGASAAGTALSVFGNPAGCSPVAPNLAPAAMLANVQAQIGNAYNLSERRQTEIWDGTAMVNVENDPFVYEFVFDEFRHPQTYKGDKVATVFMVNGFVVWFREYQGDFRLMAVAMSEGVQTSRWASYVNAYWQANGQPADKYIYPVMKKLPCHWVVEQGYVSNETLTSMFDLNWAMPDYLSSGRQYLASTCAEANKVAQEKIGYRDASSVCGPLAWTIMHDANAFPYRLGSWYADASAFTAANPKWNGQPWNVFDPETFTLTRVETSLAEYDFAARGDLFAGDLLYSYSTLYAEANSQQFDHIFLVAGVGENGARLSISNMVQFQPYRDCSIREVTLYTPGNAETGVFKREWNGAGYGKTGTTGFDIFRWNWISYHATGQARSYQVRWGETFETIAFDWKIDPSRLAMANGLSQDAQLTPGQFIVLPALQVEIAAVAE